MSMMQSTIDAVTITHPIGFVLRGLTKTKKMAHAQGMSYRRSGIQVNVMQSQDAAKFLDVTGIPTGWWIVYGG